MHRRHVLRARTLATLLLLGLGLGCMPSSRVRDAGSALLPVRQGAGPWLLQVKHVDEWDPPLVQKPGERFTQAPPGTVFRRRTDLWVRTPSGDSGYALTATGRVLVEPVNEWGVNGVAISPDGRRVAYVETTQSTGARTGPWHVLWVVNADGTDRRLLVDLDLLFPGGLPRTGALLWSSDGRHLAYVLYSRPAGASSSDDLQATVHAVEVDTGQRSALFQVPRPGLLQPLAWSTARGEFTFSLHTKTSADPGARLDTLTVYRLGTSTARATPAQGFASPDGQHLFLASRPEYRMHEPPEWLWDGATLDVPPDVVPFIPRHVAWRHEQPVAYVSTYLGATWMHEMSEDGFGLCGAMCFTSNETPPAMLYRAEGVSTRPRLERLPGHERQLVLGFSPDDAHVLVAVSSLRPRVDTEGCLSNAFDVLLVAERSAFEASTSLDSLLSASIRIDEPPSQTRQIPWGVIGWVR
ncbi:TolB family protein [Melittangium boletus]|uniref:TolB family protein n=1 Tax=Melittangium boletus TaxID=83453 RepID=UPI003DA55BF2